jgi:hypothetical protein
LTTVEGQVHRCMFAHIRQEYVEQGGPRRRDTSSVTSLCRKFQGLYRARFPDGSIPDGLTI